MTFLINGPCEAEEYSPVVPCQAGDQKKTQHADPKSWHKKHNTTAPKKKHMEHNQWHGFLGGGGCVVLWFLVVVFVLLEWHVSYCFSCLNALGASPKFEVNILHHPCTRWDLMKHPIQQRWRLGSFHDPGLRHHDLHHHHVINMFASLVLELETLAGGEYLLGRVVVFFFLRCFEMTLEKWAPGCFFVCLFVCLFVSHFSPWPLMHKTERTELRISYG